MRESAGIGGGPTSPYAEVHETHIGVVFLAGNRAYKIKKPVHTGSLDFSTPQRRRAACRREVELNSRLARTSTWAWPRSPIRWAARASRRW